jgi:hypothetical protein
VIRQALVSVNEKVDHPGGGGVIFIVCFILYPNFNVCK